jgi:hypothetical protein
VKTLFNPFAAQGTCVKSATAEEVGCAVRSFVLPASDSIKKNSSLQKETKNGFSDEIYMFEDF